jgi:hypothetical protein
MSNVFSLSFVSAAAAAAAAAAVGVPNLTVASEVRTTTLPGTR